MEKITNINKNKPKSEKLKELLGSNKIICAWINKEGGIHYSVSYMSVSDVCFLNKILNLTIDDLLHDGLEEE